YIRCHNYHTFVPAGQYVPAIRCKFMPERMAALHQSICRKQTQRRILLSSVREQAQCLQS
ncbi:hypothetical protein LI291_14825, partial [Intestinibacillus massiliensis]|nr:hypothetical protein [Intestinibacillus massiliensis]